MSRSDFEEWEKQDKIEVIDLLRKQIVTEQQLVRLYEETQGEVQSRVVRRLLHMIQLDSQKHIEICQLVIDVLQGEDILRNERREVIAGLKRHIELEKNALTLAKKVLKNVWIQETKGLQKLIKMWRDDEKKHHKALKNLTQMPFFRIEEFGGDYFLSVIQGWEKLEERYELFKAGKNKKTA